MSDVWKVRPALNVGGYWVTEGDWENQPDRIMATCFTFERAVEIADLHNWAYRLGPHRQSARVSDHMIETALRRSHGNRSKAAEMLGVWLCKNEWKPITPNPTLRSRVAE